MGWSSGRIQDAPSYKELLAIDGEAIEFEWNVLPGFSSLQILQKIQDNLRERNIKPEGFTDRIIFMSMFNDIDWTKKKETMEFVFRIQNLSRSMRRDSRKDTGRFWVLEMQTDTPAARYMFTCTLTAQITQHECTCTLAQV